MTLPLLGLADLVAGGSAGVLRGEAGQSKDQQQLFANTLALRRQKNSDALLNAQLKLYGSQNQKMQSDLAYQNDVRNFDYGLQTFLASGGLDTSGILNAINQSPYGKLHPMKSLVRNPDGSYTGTSMLGQTRVFKNADALGAAVVQGTNPMAYYAAQAKLAPELARLGLESGANAERARADRANEANAAARTAAINKEDATLNALRMGEIGRLRRQRAYGGAGAKAPTDVETLVDKLSQTYKNLYLTPTGDLRPGAPPWTQFLSEQAAADPRLAALIPKSSVTTTTAAPASAPSHWYEPWTWGNKAPAAAGGLSAAPPAPASPTVPKASTRPALSVTVPAGFKATYTAPNGAAVTWAQIAQTAANRGMTPQQVIQAIGLK